MQGRRPCSSRATVVSMVPAAPLLPDRAGQRRGGAPGGAGPSWWTWPDGAVDVVGRSSRLVAGRRGRRWSAGRAGAERARTSRRASRPPPTAMAAGRAGVAATSDRAGPPAVRTGRRSAGSVRRRSPRAGWSRGRCGTRRPARPGWPRPRRPRLLVLLLLVDRQHDALAVHQVVGHEQRRPGPHGDGHRIRRAGRDRQLAVSPCRRTISA